MGNRILLKTVVLSVKWALYICEKITRLFGVRLCSLEMTEVLKGLPPEVAKEANNPEIAEPLRLMMDEMQ